MYRYLFNLIFLFCFSVSNGNIDSERVFIQTDRDIYIAGENVFYCMNVFTDDSNPSQVFYLLLRNEKHVFNRLYIKASGKDAYGSFYLPDTLQTGFYEIVAYTNYLRNFGEKEYFRKNIIVVNRFDEKLSNLYDPNNLITHSTISGENQPVLISLNKDSFKVREKIPIDLKPNLPDQIDSIVSVTIKEANSYSAYLKSSSSKNASLTPTSENSEYPKETEGIILTGVILSKDSVPIAGECLFLSTPDSVANLQYAYSNKDGRFQFLLPEFYLGKQLIISSGEKREEYIIDIEDKFDLRLPYIPPALGITPELRRYILESQRLVTIHKTYNIKNVQHQTIERTNHSVPYVYKDAFKIVYPSDYTSLNNLWEISQNLLPEMNLKDDKLTRQPYLFNTVSKQFFQTPAKVFLNGVPLYNLNQLMGWSSSAIARIELCQALRVKGDIAFAGIFSIYSKQAVDPVSFIPNATSYRMGVFADKSTYSTPRYFDLTYKDPMPDFRQLLYWNPHLKLNSGSIEFFASDWPAEYIIEVTGTNSAGETFKAYSKLVVYD